MDHEIYLKFIELDTKYEYIYNELLKAGIIKEEKEKKKEEVKK